MSFFDRMFGQVSAARKGSRAIRRWPSRKPQRCLRLEQMEPRMMFSASPLPAPSLTATP